MEKYNDELLTPANYELLAKEYSKSMKKNIKFVEIKIDETKKFELKNDILSNSNIISNCLNYLKKCNLKQNKKTILNELCNTYNKHKNFINTLNIDAIPINGIGKNYCACLVIIINCCTNSLNTILQIKDYLNDEEAQNYFEQIQLLSKIINQTTQMFGVCKYRE